VKGNKKTISSFQETIWDFFEKEGRQTLAWRKTKNPYRIWVSEIMLQQTQVSRVVEKYKSFLKKFPTIEALAKSSQAEVLKEWVGLGYNRRALFLKRGAEFVIKDLKGRFPKEVSELETIPGIGYYTARAIATFAYNQRHVFVETNIRTVYFNHFFTDPDSVHDKEVLEMVEKTLPEEGFREWYWALMDYGSFLKKQGKGKNTQSRHYTRQSRFEGSDRQIRAAVVRYLTQKGEADVDDVIRELGFDIDRTEEQIQKLLDEEMVFLQNGILSLD
jgi:A/G-specific adenine glycosylase